MHSADDSTCELRRKHFTIVLNEYLFRWRATLADRYKSILHFLHPPKSTSRHWSVWSFLFSVSAFSCGVLSAICAALRLMDSCSCPIHGHSGDDWSANQHRPLKHEIHWIIGEARIIERINHHDSEKSWECECRARNEYQVRPVVGEICEYTLNADHIVHPSYHECTRRSTLKSNRKNELKIYFYRAYHVISHCRTDFER